MTAAPEARWTRLHWLAVALVVLVGIAIRIVLLPAAGLKGDIDQFVGWVHHIATEGLGTLYGGTEAGDVAFGPVMAYVWGVLAAVQPAFATVVDSSDQGIRMMMKLPASIADFGLAAVAMTALRHRPWWAVLGAAAVLLHPAVIYVSAWWGQYESIFVLSGLAAAYAAAQGRTGIAAALVAVSLATKPQAIQFIVPFAAWFWAIGNQRDGSRGGLLGLAKAALVGAAVTLVLWLPFLPHGGPFGYLESLRYYQDEVFNALSLNAWNVWWLLQEATPGQGFLADDIAIAGPITLRVVGLAVTALLSLVIAAGIVRDPRPRTFILGLVASVLVVFTFMTQMHERYAYAALPLLVLLLPDVRARWLWLVSSIVVTLNLIAAVPPTAEIASVIPVSGVLGVVGSLAMIALPLVALLASRPDGGSTTPRPAPGEE